MRVDVLGPLRVLDADGRDVTPDGDLQRRLFALLVLHRGRVVSADEAVDALWPSRAPRDPTAALQNHVFRLRRGLPGDVIESTQHGYRLRPEAIDVDADRLAAALRERETGGASALDVDQLLAAWQGPAYPDLADVDDGRTEALRLDELRTRAVEARAEQRLAEGRTDGLVAELAALAERHPLRERPHELLMSSLAAAGRTVEALRVYDDFRRRLGDELGVEPSPALAAKHAALLQGADATAWSPTTRLPAPVTSLVGRDRLLAEVVALTRASRLITLLGPGGVGKTRLVIEVGHRLRDADPARPVVMCELATAGPDSTVDAVAAALGVEGRPGVGLTERLVAALADADAVLLFDNCEHVLDPVAALVEAILTACPGVTVIATSRERMRVPGERLCRVPPLEAAADDAPAVKLFIERAQAAAPGFAPDERETATIAEIVQRLDGLPLAIELAAARLHTLDVAEVAAGLDRRFVLLSSGFRTSSRHGSLAATVSWSFDQLDPAVQRIFLDVSTFAGPFTVADAAAVCDLPAFEVVAALDQLVERSLVMRTPDRRYVLLETLRAFGAEQATAAAAGHGAADRHARHFVDWMEAADRRLVDDEAGTVIAEVDEALPELRNALSHSLERGDVEQAGRLIRSLMHYGFLRLRPDVLAWSKRVTDADPDDRGSLAATVWAARTYASWMSGEGAAARDHAARARKLQEQAGETFPEVAAILGNGALFEGALDQASAWYRRSAEQSGDHPGRRLMAEATDLLARGYAGDEQVVDMTRTLLASVGESAGPLVAYAWFCAGEADLAVVGPAPARALFRRAIELAEPAKASFVTGAAGASLASIEARSGDAAAAADDYRRLMTHWRRAGMWPTQWTMLRSVAGLLARLGRFRDAAVLEGAVRTTSSGHRIFGADEVMLGELGARLLAELGAEAYEGARRQGAVLDGDGAVEHALRALSDAR